MRCERDCVFTHHGNGRVGERMEEAGRPKNRAPEDGVCTFLFTSSDSKSVYCRCVVVRGTSGARRPRQLVQFVGRCVVVVVAKREVAWGGHNRISWLVGMITKRGPGSIRRWFQLPGNGRQGEKMMLTPAAAISGARRSASSESESVASLASELERHLQHYGPP